VGTQQNYPHYQIDPILTVTDLCILRIMITTSAACALAQVLPRPQLIFPSKTWFLLNLFEFFSSRNHFKINISHILNPNLTKYIPLNPAHQDLSNNNKGTFQFLLNF
jgi:hypothetical protein